MNPNINNGLWVMCQCNIIKCNKCITVVGMLIVREAADVCKLSVSSVQFCCEPKIALRHSSIKNKIKTSSQILT